MRIPSLTPTTQEEDVRCYTHKRLNCVICDPGVTALRASSVDVDGRASVEVGGYAEESRCAPSESSYSTDPGSTSYDSSC